MAKRIILERMATVSSSETWQSMNSAIDTEGCPVAVVTVSFAGTVASSTLNIGLQHALHKSGDEFQDVGTYYSMASGTGGTVRWQLTNFGRFLRWHKWGSGTAVFRSIDVFLREA